MWNIFDSWVNFFNKNTNLLEAILLLTLKKKKFSDIEIEVLDVIGSNPEKEKRLMGCDFVSVCVFFFFFFKVDSLKKRGFNDSFFDNF